MHNILHWLHWFDFSPQCTSRSTLYLTWKAFYLDAGALHCHDKQCIWHWAGLLHDTSVYCRVYCAVCHTIPPCAYCAVCHPVHSVTLCILYLPPVPCIQLTALHTVHTILYIIQNRIISHHITLALAS